MSGLMLADKTAGLEERLRESENQIHALQAEIEALRNREPERVEVPVIPNDLTDALAEMAARAESLADSVEEKAAT
jgi:cell division protein ZapA